MVGDLQEGIKIIDTRIGGTLNYISDYTAAGFEMDKGHHFIALHATADQGAVITVEVLGGYYGETTVDPSDGIMILQLHSNAEKIKIKATKNGMAEVQIFDLKNLTLAAAE